MKLFKNIIKNDQTYGKRIVLPEGFCSFSGVQSWFHQYYPVIHWENAYEHTIQHITYLN